MELIKYCTKNDKIEEEVKSEGQDSFGALVKDIA